MCRCRETYSAAGRVTGAGPKPITEMSIIRYRATVAVFLAACSGLGAHDGSHGNAELDAKIAKWRAEQTARLGVAPGVAAAPPSGYGATIEYTATIGSDCCSDLTLTISTPTADCPTNLTITPRC